MEFTNTTRTFPFRFGLVNVYSPHAPPIVHESLMGAKIEAQMVDPGRVGTMRQYATGPLFLCLVIACGSDSSDRSPTQSGDDPPVTPTLQEYAVPAGSRPHDVAPAIDSGVWYTAQRQGALGHLDPATGATRHIRLGTGSVTSLIATLVACGVIYLISHSRMAVRLESAGHISSQSAVGRDLAFAAGLGDAIMWAIPIYLVVFLLVRWTWKTSS